MHPSILSLGLKMADGTINGSDARCVGLFTALKDMINDFITPSQKLFATEMMSALKPCINYLKVCASV